MKSLLYISVKYYTGKKKKGEYQATILGLPGTKYYRTFHTGDFVIDFNACYDWAYAHYRHTHKFMLDVTVDKFILESDDIYQYNYFKSNKVADSKAFKTIKDENALKGNKKTKKIDIKKLDKVVDFDFKNKNKEN